MKRLVPIIGLIFSLLLANPVIAQMGRIEEGKPFPTFTLPSLDGEPATIADYRGKKVLLANFASW